MLKLAGIESHPALRAVIGAALLVAGIARHATAMTAIGVALVLWSLAGGQFGRSRSDAPDGRDR